MNGSTPYDHERRVSFPPRPLHSTIITAAALESACTDPHPKPRVCASAAGEICHKLLRVNDIFNAGMRNQFMPTKC
jgi:hypothetical protein